MSQINYIPITKAKVKGMHKLFDLQDTTHIDQFIHLKQGEFVSKYFNKDIEYNDNAIILIVCDKEDQTILGDAYAEGSSFLLAQGVMISSQTGVTKEWISSTFATITSLNDLNVKLEEETQRIDTNINSITNELTNVKSTLKSKVGQEQLSWEIGKINTNIDKKADLSHTHIMSDITDLDIHTDQLSGSNLKLIILDGETEKYRLTLKENDLEKLNYLLKKNILVKAISNNENMGSVTGSGVYLTGEEVLLEATPKDDCVFVKWNDETTDPIYIITTSEDTTFEAFFRNYIYVTSIDGAPQKINISEGNTSSFDVTITPEDADNKTIKWTSSDETVAAIDSDQTTSTHVVVNGVASGSAFVTGTSGDGHATTSTSVIVSASVIPMTSIELRDADGNIISGNFYTVSQLGDFSLTCIYEPTSTTDSTIVWSINGSTTGNDIVSIDTEKTDDTHCYMTALDSGTVNIVAQSSAWPDVCSNISIIVSTPVENVILDQEEVTIQKSGDPTTLTATITPSTAKVKEVTWSVSDEGIVNLAPNGNTCEVSGIGVGMCTIDAIADDKSASCLITVEGSAETKTTNITQSTLGLTATYTTSSKTVDNVNVQWKQAMKGNSGIQMNKTKNSAITMEVSGTIKNVTVTSTYSSSKNMNVYQGTTAYDETTLLGSTSTLAKDATWTYDSIDSSNGSFITIIPDTGAVYVSISVTYEI